MGGTYVTIWGVGFDNAGKQGTTAVFFGNTQARIEWYDSTDTKLAVWTAVPPAEGTVDVRVQIMNLNSRAAYAPCQASSCTFTFSWGRTPRVSTAFLGGAAGDIFRMSGQLFAAATSMYKVRHGGRYCDLDDSLFADPAAIADASGSAAVRCFIGDGPAGRMNTSVIVGDNSNGYGESWTARRAQSVAADGSVFHFTRVPAVTAASAGTCGMGGGCEVVITGTGFTLNAADSNVTLAGVPCNITSSTATEIRCQVAPAPAGMMENAAAASSAVVNSTANMATIGGSRGLRHRIWYGAMDFIVASSSRRPDVDIINNFGAQGYIDSMADNYVQELSGIFTPPVTANYSFYVRGDDNIVVQLSQSSDFAGLTTVASAYGNTWAYYQSAGQISAPIPMQAGKAYAFRALHSDQIGPDWFDVSLRISAPAGSAAAALLASPAQRDFMSVPDVQSVYLGTSVTREQQSFTVTNAVDGMFTLTWAGQNTAALPMLWWNATTDDVRSALASRTSCSNLGVTRTSVTGGTPARTVGFRWTVTFNCASRAGYALVTPVSVTLAAAFNTTLDMTSTRIVAASAPLTGRFLLSLDGGVNAASVPVTASNSQIWSAIMSLPGVVEAEIAGPWGNGQDSLSFDVTFWRPNTNVSALAVLTSTVVDGVLVTGENLQATVTRRMQGSADPFFWPIPADFFSVAQRTPALVVTTNGIRAACASIINTTSPTGVALPGAAGRDACSFTYQAALTPFATSVTPLSASVGAVLTISGSGFLTAADGIARGPGGTNLGVEVLNQVLVGPARCNVTAATATQLQCTLSHAPAGTFPVRVIVGLSRGVAMANATMASALQITYTGALLSVSPAVGSTAGGTVLTIAGTGFRGPTGADAVSVGGQPCTVRTASFSEITCVTAPGTSTTAAVVVNGVAASFTFAYSGAATPVIIAMTPTRLPAAISGVINVTVSGVPPTATVSVTLDRRTCRVDRVAPAPAGGATLITCTLIRGAPAALPQMPTAPVVFVSGLGNADAGVFRFDASYRVTAMSSQLGSLEGGTVVALQGTGFSRQAGATEVFLSHTDGWGYNYMTVCNVTGVSTDGTQVSLTVPQVPTLKRGGPPGSPVFSTVIGALVVKVNNVTAPCSDSLSGCAFHLRANATPVIATAEQADATTLALDGTLLASQAASLSVMVGTQACGSVRALNASAVACTLQVGRAGPSVVTATHAQWGHVLVNTSYRHPYPLAVSMQQSNGSTAGGSLVTFAGVGFAAGGADWATANVVLFGTTQAVVQSATATALTVMTPPSTSATDRTVDVTVIVMDEQGVNANARLVLASAFLYSAALTPAISSVAPSASLVMGQRLLIAGSGFGTDAGAVRVVIGGVACIVAGASASAINCTLGATPAGTHRVLVSIAGRGLARASTGAGITVTVRASITAVAPFGAASGDASSFGGGADFVITGTGFGEDNRVSSVTVSACNTQCIVRTFNATSITCRSAPLVTASAVSAYNVWAPARITGARITPTTAAGAYDERIDAAFTSCTVQMDLGAEAAMLITGVRFYPKFRATQYMTGATFAASMDGAMWVTLHTVGSYVQEAWNTVNLYNGPGAPTVDAGTLPAYRYGRLVFARTGAECTANEIEFIGIPVAARSSGACPVNVTVTPVVSNALLEGTPAATVVAAAGTITYAAAVTMFITGISPNNGTALGGTPVVITGTGFPADPAAVSVSFNGVPARVVASSPSSITVLTGARDAIRPLSVSVRTDTGAAVYDPSMVYFRYLDRWSALTTWKYQEPPVDGDTVLVPEGQAILVDVSPPRLFLVLVEGDMVFDRRDLTFNASYILVHGGKLEIGSEAQPFLNRLVITLHGDRYTSVEIPGIGAKMLAVTFRTMAMSATGAQLRSYSQGALDIHGRPRKRVWTKLGAPAPAGSNTLVMAEDVDWEAGDVLFVTCTRDVTKTEVVTVAQVVDARSVALTAPLQYDHEYKIFSAGQYGHSDVDMRAEVGLLSRNVVIQGDDDSHAQDYGVHTGAFMAAAYRVENAEIRRCGQSGQLGRYCTHTHMLGGRTDSYVRYNSIHTSYQRSTTIHATNHLTVKGNAVYDVRGHTLFVEDGVEQFNVIEENLIARTHPCYYCTMSDNRPANFWTASPTNLWRHNVAAGSSHFGFWFELPGNPLGPSYTPYYCPSSMPLGEFYNNTAHSSSMGIRIYPIWLPLANPCAGGGATSPQYLVNSTLFHNSLGTFNRRVGDIHHVNAKYVENADGFGWRQFPGVPYGNDPNVRDTLFACTTGHPSGCGSRAITAPQDEFWYGSGITFVNYGTSAVLFGCHSCNSDSNFKQGGYTYRFDRLAWVSSFVRVGWNEPRKEMFRDLDSTLTGHVNGTAMAFWAFNNWPQCPRDTAGTYSGGIVCDGTVQARRMHLDNVLPSQLYWLNLNISSRAGSALLQFRPRETYGWSWPLVIARDYSVSFVSTGQIDWRQLRLRYSVPEYVLPTDWLRLSWSWIDYRYRNRVLYAGSEVPALPVGATAPQPTHAIGTGNMPDANNRTWTVLFSTVNATSADPGARYTLDVTSVQCPPRGCLPPQEPTSLSNATMWSNPLSWPGGVVPGAGDSVVINASTWMVFDVDVTPVLKRLTVFGRLEFADAPSGSRTLAAEAIVVFGELVVGTPAAPYRGAANIVLHGTRTSDAVIVNNNVFASNKVLLVFGQVTLVGAPRNVTSTRLQSTAAAGDTTLRLTQSVDGAWAPGDVIAVSATEYNHTQVETAVISSVAGSVVTLTLPLRFRHFAGSMLRNGTTMPSNASAPTTVLRATVSLLSRNVIVRGNTVNDADQYGAHVMVTSFIENAGTRTETRREGSLFARHVQFARCGKAGSEFAAIAFQYGRFLFAPATPARNPVNVLDGVALVDGFNDGIRATAAKSLALVNSVVYRTQIYALSIDADSVGANITNNVFLAAQSGVDTNAPGQIAWVRPQSAVYMTSMPAVFSNNTVSGAFDSAYTYIPPACAAAHEALFSGNEAHGVRIGFYLLVSGSGGAGTWADCVRVHGATVWKAAHMGIFTVDQTANLQITGSVVTDSHIGITALFLRAGSRENSMRIINSLIGGSTAATNGCAEASVCRAANKADVVGAGCNSVFGGATRRVGIAMPQYLNKPKTCGGGAELAVCDPLNMIERLCSLPLETRYGTTSTVVAELQLSGVTFVGFNGTECSGAKSVAIAHNPSQIDTTVPTTASRVTWIDTPVAGRFSFTTSDATPEQCADGVGCDGFNNINILDADGTLTGVRGSTVLGPNPASAPPSCTWRQQWPGLECTGLRVRSVSVSNQVSSRIAVGAISVTRQWNPADNSTWRTSLVAGPTKEPCSKMSPTPIWQVLTTSRVPLSMAWASLEPDAFRLQWAAPDATDGVVVSISIQRAFAWDVFVDGVSKPQLVAPNATTYFLPTVTDDAGTMLFHPQQKRMWVTLRGGAPLRRVDIVRTPAIALNLHLAVSVEQFYAADFVFNLATLLNIPSWRIKVVDVQPGSAAVTAIILDAQPTVLVDSNTNASAVNASLAQIARLTNLTSTIQSMAAVGALNSIGSIPVLALAVAAPPPLDLGDAANSTSNATDAAPITIALPTLSPTPSATPSSSPPLVGVTVAGVASSSSSGLSAGIVAAIVIGAVAGVAVVAGIFVAIQRHRILLLQPNDTHKVARANAVRESWRGAFTSPIQRHGHPEVVISPSPTAAAAAVASQGAATPHVVPLAMSREAAVLVQAHTYAKGRVGVQSYRNTTFGPTSSSQRDLTQSASM